MKKERLGEIGPSDLRDVVALHRAAFSQSLMIKLGDEAIRRYYLWQFQGPHETYASGAWINGRLVGFCFGGIHPSGISGFLTRNRAFLMCRLLTRPWLITDPLVFGLLKQKIRSVRSRRQLPKISTVSAPKNVKLPYDILSIAVHPAMQGAGIGKMLLARAQDQALNNGFHVMSLFVKPENEQAIRFYERCGWERRLQNGVWRGPMEKWLKRDPAPQAPQECDGNNALSSL